MIQRIQSVYLLVVFLITCIMFFANPKYAIFKGTANQAQSTEIRYITNVDSAKVSSIKPFHFLLVTAIGLSAVVALFLYKKTDWQKKLCIYNTLLSLVLAVLLYIDYSFISNKHTEMLSSIGFHAVWPFVTAFLYFLAWRAIKSDENLLNSMDRLR